MIYSYRVSGGRSGGGLGLLPFLRLSVDAFQNSGGGAGDTLLSVLVNTQRCRRYISGLKMVR